MAEDLETLKNDVWVRLPQLTGEELATMCSGLNLTVPEAKQSTKSVLYTLVLQQLMSVEAEGLDDQAAKDLFLNIKGSIDQLFKIREIKLEQENRARDADEQDAGHSGGGNGVTGITDPPVVVPSSLENVSTNTGNDGLNVTANSTVNVMPSLSQRFASFSASQSQLLSVNDARRRASDVLRLRRDFKIDGTVGKGSKDSLSYSSLCYQIQQGKDAGYTSAEIRKAVVGATKPGSFKTYLEGLRHVSEAAFLEALQINYNEKKAFKMLNEMSRCFQNDSQALETNENEVQFCMRMFGYCDQIRKISREEGQPIDEKLILDTLYSSLSTGFKQGAVRLELQ